MSAVDGFWFQVGRNVADLIMAIGVLAIIGASIFVIAFGSAAIEYFRISQKNKDKND